MPEKEVTKISNCIRRGMGNINNFIFLSLSLLRMICIRNLMIHNILWRRFLTRTSQVSCSI